MDTTLNMTLAHVVGDATVVRPEIVRSASPARARSGATSPSAATGLTVTGPTAPVMTGTARFGYTPTVTASALRFAVGGIGVPPRGDPA